MAVFHWKTMNLQADVAASVPAGNHRNGRPHPREAASDPEQLAGIRAGGGAASSRAFPRVTGTRSGQGVLVTPMPLGSLLAIRGILRDRCGGSSGGTDAPFGEAAAVLIPV